MCMHVCEHACVCERVCVSVCVCACVRPGNLGSPLCLHCISVPLTWMLCPLPGSVLGRPGEPSCCPALLPGTPLLKGKESSPSDHDAPGVREGGHQGGPCWCPCPGCDSGGPPGGSDSTPSTLVSFPSGSTGPGWEGTQRGLEQNP